VETTIALVKCYLDGVGIQTARLRNSASIVGLRVLKFALGGIMPRSRTIIDLIRPATPLAPSKCPTLLLTAPLPTTISLSPCCNLIRLFNLLT